MLRSISYSLLGFQLFSWHPIPWESQNLWTEVELVQPGGCDREFWFLVSALYISFYCLCSTITSHLFIDTIKNRGIEVPVKQDTQTSVDMDADQIKGCVPIDFRMECRLFLKNLMKISVIRGNEHKAR